MHHVIGITLDSMRLMVIFDPFQMVSQLVGRWKCYGWNLHLLYQKVFCPLYKDVKDEEEGFWVGMKANSGPGRLNALFLGNSFCLYGFYFFPGLPNGTELRQEMDQLFAFLQSIIEENRKELYKILFQQCEGRIPKDDEDDDDFYIIEREDEDDDGKLINIDAIDDHFYNLLQQ